MCHARKRDALLRGRARVGRDGRLLPSKGPPAPATATALLPSFLPVPPSLPRLYRGLPTWALRQGEHTSTARRAAQVPVLTSAFAPWPLPARRSIAKPFPAERLSYRRPSEALCRRGEMSSRGLETKANPDQAPAVLGADALRAKAAGAKNRGRADLRDALPCKTFKP